MIVDIATWSAVASLDDPHIVHVIPLRDLVEHDADSTYADCVCGPGTEFVGPAHDGADAWLIQHHSLDGREHGKD